MTRSAGTNDEQLRRIRTVTDPALSELDADRLLEELLERTRRLLNADTAVVLLLDAHARQLTATAAKGLEEEVRQGFRVSVGRGFAGRIAREARPIIIDDVAPGDVVNPILLARRIRSLLGVPLVAAGQLIGVLHVGSLSPRHFGDDDLTLLQMVAERVTLACQARSAKLDREATLALQRSLLPTLLPSLPGLDLAARYVPGHQSDVGGDWYDVFTLPDGRLGLVMGDVAGHGLHSAVVMGRLRSALRAYALICDNPAEALSHLDRKMRYFEPGSVATVLYAIISEDRATIDVAIAGHPSPVLAEPGRPAAPLHLAVDPLLGLGITEKPRRRTLVEFPPGSVLVCYTDGLVERRGESIDVGVRRLCATVHTGPAETVCATIMESVGLEQPMDDTAVLAVSRHTAA